MKANQGFFHGLLKAIALLSFVTPLMAAEPALAIIGKNEWVFYRHEISTASDDAEVKKSLGLIAKFNKVLADQGIRLVVVVVPLKMRIYAEHLPNELALTDYLRGNYARMLEFLKANDVLMVDLNSAFLNDPGRASDTPFYFRLDSHWSPSGVMAAADAVKAGVMADPATRKLIEALPEAAYTRKISPRKRKSKPGDLVGLLPPDAPTLAADMVPQITVERTQPAATNLLGNQALPEFAMLGSSYSHEWTGFPGALNFAFQRDLTSLSVGADQGSWVGMESYLRNEAFQAKRPKVLIWELPERDMRAGPDYKYRDARYISGNAEWLQRVSALVSARP